MAEHNLTYDQQQDVESHAPYGTVFFILLNFTLMEYIYASYYRTTAMFFLLLGATLALTLLTWVAKLTLHIQYNRRWVYLTLIPALALSFLGAALPLLLGLLVLAFTKAALVGIYFMHLKFEGRWVYYMLVPAGILATVFIVALYPDIGLQPGEQAAAAEVEEEENAAPATPAVPSPVPSPARTPGS
jgi:hypothetical protein